ncbi:MAG TPA: sugar transferase [Jatrophihabitans sp.]|nr:sugar transferase [Jatrophihabitans sp.]
MSAAVIRRPGKFRDTNRRLMLHGALLAISDIAALYAALLIAYAIRASNPQPFLHPTSIGRFAWVAATVAPGWVLIFGALGLYASGPKRPFSGECVRIAFGACFGVMVLVCIDYLRNDIVVFPARSVPVYGFLIGAAMVALFRALLRLGVRTAYSRGIGLHSVIILGSDALATRLVAYLRRPGSGYQVVAAVAPEEDGGTLLGDIPVYHDFESAMAAQVAPVDEIVQADVNMDRDEVTRLMSLANAEGITYRFVPDRFGVYAASSRLKAIDGIPVLDVRLTSLDGWAAVVKRIFDFAVTSLLVVLLLPLFAAVALAVKLREPTAPLLYRQERVGRRGKTIRILKFRSMLWEYSTGPDRKYTTPYDAFLAMGREDLCAEFLRDHKVQDDPRVTAIGRFLRRTSLDELPQLFNVLKGDLSLIGPRPITPEELERYGAQQYSLLALKPGVTGLWQVSGRSDVSYEERVKLDVFYIENWSVSLDARILAKTPIAVVAKRGAV